MACLFTFQMSIATFEQRNWKEYGSFVCLPKHLVLHMTIFLDLGFTHSGKKAISCGVLENMFPEKHAEMNIKIGRQRFAALNLHNIWFSTAECPHEFQGLERNQRLLTKFSTMASKVFDASPTDGFQSQKPFN